ncbi:superoxide dismutase [Ni] [Fibrobacterota bacterium]
MRYVFTLLIALTATFSLLYSHCEIPCGIYDDALRINLLKEHAGTINKSITAINKLAKETPADQNQLVRWINNKEDHANKIQEIVTQYFMTQRIKVTSPKAKDGHERYMAQLGRLHEILVYAMKTKQSTDARYVEKLSNAIDAFEKAYMGEKKKK